METVIGMLLAFILGAMAVITTIALTNPTLLKRTYSASVVSASDRLQKYESAMTPEEAKQQEEADQYIMEIENMYKYSGKKQGDLNG